MVHRNSLGEPAFEVGQTGHTDFDPKRCVAGGGDNTDGRNRRSQQRRPEDKDRYEVIEQQQRRQ